MGFFADVRRLEAMTDLQAEQARAQRLLAHGVTGTAVVTGVRDTGVTVALHPQLEFDLRVTLDGRDEPYPVTHRQVVSRLAAATMGVGTTVPVRVDPDDPGALLIA